MKKRLLVLILVAVLICACGNKTASSQDDQGTDNNNGLTTNGDIIAESQETRRSLREKIEHAQTVLNSLEGREGSDYTGKYLSGYNASDEQNEYEEESIEQQDNMEKKVLDDNTSRAFDNTDYENSVTTDINTTLPEIPSNTGKYTSVTIDQLNNELEENAMRAENSWNDKYVVMSGYINNIDNDGTYFGISGENTWGTVTCMLNKNEEAKKTIMNYNTGDAVIVYGKISSIGEVLGYSIDVDKVDGEATSTAPTGTSAITTNGKYKVVTVGDLQNALESNAMRAEGDWKDQYVQVTGCFDSVDSDGKYFHINNAPGEFFSIGVSMERNEGVKSIIMNKNKGDKVVVKGKITEVGEIIGIHIDAESVE